MDLNQMLIEIIIKKSKEDFEKLCTALEMTGQKLFADVLQNGAGWWRIWKCWNVCDISVGLCKILFVNIHNDGLHRGPIISREVQRAMAVLKCYIIILTELMNAIRTHYKTIVMFLYSRSVAAHMYQDGALTMNEMDSVRLKQTLGDSNERLLHLVTERPVVMLNSFLNALRVTNQEHVYSTLLFKGN